MHWAASFDGAVRLGDILEDFGMKTLVLLYDLGTVGGTQSRSSGSPIPSRGSSIRASSKPPAAAVLKTAVPLGLC
jgi:hypothetical protein